MATMWLLRYPRFLQPLICMLRRRQTEGWGQCWVDKSHQGITFRKDLCVLPQTTLLCVCSALIRQMGWNRSPEAEQKRVGNKLDWLLQEYTQPVSAKFLPFFIALTKQSAWYRQIGYVLQGYVNGIKIHDVILTLLIYKSERRDNFRSCMPNRQTALFF